MWFKVVESLMKGADAGGRVETMVRELERALGGKKDLVKMSRQ